MRFWIGIGIPHPCFPSCPGGFGVWIPKERPGFIPPQKNLLFPAPAIPNFLSLQELGFRLDFSPMDLGLFPGIAHTQLLQAPFLSGICSFPDSQIPPEWALFHQHHPEPIPIHGKTSPGYSQHRECPSMELRDLGSGESAQGSILPKNRDRGFSTEHEEPGSPPAVLGGEDTPSLFQCHSQQLEKCSRVE